MSHCGEAAQGSPHPLAVHTSELSSVLSLQPPSCPLSPKPHSHFRLPCLTTENSARPTFIRPILCYNLWYLVHRGTFRLVLIFINTILNSNITFWGFGVCFKFSPKSNAFSPLTALAGPLPRGPSVVLPPRPWHLLTEALGPPLRHCFRIYLTHLFALSGS